MTIPTMRELRLMRRGMGQQVNQQPQSPPGARAICLKCDKLETCQSVEVCKSCGGRRVVKRITSPCPEGKFTFDAENKK